MIARGTAGTTRATGAGVVLEQETSDDVGILDLAARWQAIRDAHGLSTDLMANRTGPIVDRPIFNAFIGTVILANAVVMGLELEFSPTDAEFEETIVPWYILENIFAAVWFMEMTMRMYYKGCRYFSDSWNCFDFFLVVVTVVDTYLLTFIGGAVKGLKIFSLLRMLRILRLLRLLRVFKELWLIVVGFTNSFRTLSWIGLLLFIEVYVTGIFFTLMVGKDCREPEPIGPPLEWRETCMYLWGDVLHSMLTLYQTITLESWAEAIARPTARFKPWILPFILWFQWVTTFGLLNVIVGVICESTLDASTNDEGKRRAHEANVRNREMEILRGIFSAADGDGTGTVSSEELKAAMQADTAKMQLEALNLQTDEIDDLFYILDQDRSGSLEIEEFFSCVFTVKGGARARDSTETMQRLRRFERDLKAIADTLILGQRKEGCTSPAGTATPDTVLNGRQSERVSNYKAKHQGSLPSQQRVWELGSDVRSAADFLAEAIRGRGAAGAPIPQRAVLNCAEEVVASLRRGPAVWTIQPSTAKPSSASRFLEAVVMDEASSILSVCHRLTTTVAKDMASGPTPAGFVALQSTVFASNASHRSASRKKTGGSTV
mmetsp:Transcript_119071/g.273056  ORF Transcript_119071/g.273056 Transcript_119071/m.273056 type:complete len:605 (+) Transcript_119071:95-1909(+)